VCFTGWCSSTCFIWPLRTSVSERKESWALTDQRKAGNKRATAYNRQTERVFIGGFSKVDVDYKDDKVPRPGRKDVEREAISSGHVVKIG